MLLTLLTFISEHAVAVFAAIGLVVAVALGIPWWRERKARKDRRRFAKWG
ncbi:hypothetical protein [Piscinibacter koreensis]|uniref:Uncharacterized protein n=1 Tax=Piscinibacter koreensis TaxID=2742824 RepID=A0A7Y6TXN7_9BURK|nr:hypothetical protein [Schlegelella koreensis]NUZ07251.1 hypothetical protein [Schlegelella koreensis]